MKFEKYKTKSGKTKWRFYHYLGINPDTGKSVEVKRRGFDTQKEARNELMEIINKYEKGQSFTKFNKDRYHFSEVAELWLVHYETQVKVTTFTNRKNLIYNHIFPFLKIII